jgi:undecaprenyl-phosphate 4-deoxy-4-formamido-L-arabinose transferase
MINLSFLIPVFNGELTITALINNLIDEFAPTTKLEIVLVNDGSRDNSAEICKNLQCLYPEVITYIELTRNFGEHNALIAGLSVVTGDYCITMDDDLQNPPEESWKLINEIQKGYDVVYSYFDKKQDAFFRNMGSKFHNKMASIVLKKPTDLYLSSYKIMNRIVVNEIIKFTGPDPYIDGIILRTTNRIGKVKVAHYPRMQGKSGYNIIKLISLWGNMMLNYSLIPLRIIGLIGMITVLYSVYFGIERFFFEEPYYDITDHQAVILSIFSLIGLLFISIALLSEYIGRTHLLLNVQPQYIIRECHKANSNNESRIDIN